VPRQGEGDNLAAVSVIKDRQQWCQRGVELQVQRSRASMRHRASSVRRSGASGARQASGMDEQGVGRAVEL
jgi:hypothetical protein